MEKKERQKRVTHHVDPLEIKESIGENNEKTRLFFSIRLNDLLKDKGTAQEDLADKTGLAMSSISNYRRGKAEPRITAFNEIARVLNVSTDYLLGNATDPTTDPDKKVACEYTGLSGQAIDAILNAGEIIDPYYYDTLGFKPPLIEILNTLCEEGFIPELTKAIGRCLYEIIIRKNYFEHFHSIEQEQSIMLPALGYLNKEIEDELKKVMKPLMLELKDYYISGGESL